jgi:dTDP-4-dehydrorhamnose reductase
MGAADVVVLGAGGLLGRTVVRRWTGCRGFTHQELDIADADAVHEAIESVRPGVVVNCAAMTNVDNCEAEPERAWAINAEGAGHVARAAAGVGAEVIHISTDYVFDGSRGNYTESDETNPLQVYGRAKLGGEDLVRTGNARHYVIRSAWIYGERGHNFVSHIPELVAKGEPVRAIADQRSSPTLASDLADALATTIGSERYGTYHVVNEGSCSYAEFAQHVAGVAGDEVGVIGISTADMPRRAARPRDSSLVGPVWVERGFVQLRPWREAAAQFYSDVQRLRTA